MKNSNRIVFIDYVRVIACFLVMLVHASENFYCISADTTMLANESNRFWVAFYDGALGRMSVPLFMVVSAFLLVPVKPNVSMSDFYKHRFKRIIPPLVFFMLIYCFLPLAWGQMTWEQSWQDFRLLPFTFPSMAGHLWFMYPLISLYHHSGSFTVAGTRFGQRRTSFSHLLYAVYSCSLADPVCQF